MMKNIVVLAALGATLAVVGCSDNTSGPQTASGGAVPVVVTASAMSSTGPLQLGKVSGSASPLAVVDSIRIDDALLIFKDISFAPGIDTVHELDSAKCEWEDEQEEHGGGEKVEHVHFKGPFLVVLHNNAPVQVAVDTIPPGVYDGITFKIHRLRRSDVMRNPLLPDSLVGYSIVISGAVKYSGGDWTPFVFKTDINEAFKVRGNFTVMPGDKLVPYVLQFDIASWFTDPSGRILDPNGTMDRYMIRHAIKSALGGGMRGGRDHDDDGRPD